MFCTAQMGRVIANFYFRSSCPTLANRDPWTVSPAEARQFPPPSLVFRVVGESILLLALFH